MFDGKFKISEAAQSLDAELEIIDLDTLPNEGPLVKAHGMAAEAEELLVKGKDVENVLTHASDSTTKKDVKSSIFLPFTSRKEMLSKLPWGSSCWHWLLGRIPKICTR